MKTIQLLCFAIVALTFINCSNDDDATPSTTNGITIAGNFTATPNAYVIFDRTAPYDDGFFFALADGTLINNAGDNVLSNTNTTIAAALLVDNGGQVASQNLVNFNISNYTLEKDDTTVLEDIIGFTNTEVINGTTYGQIDDDTATEYIIENAGFGSLDITTITKDFAARNGTITCTFSITDDNGIVITGYYSGTFIMLNGDT